MEEKCVTAVEYLPGVYFTQQVQKEGKFYFVTFLANKVSMANLGTTSPFTASILCRCEDLVVHTDPQHHIRLDQVKHEPLPGWVSVFKAALRSVVLRAFPSAHQHTIKVPV